MKKSKQTGSRVEFKFELSLAVFVNLSSGHWIRKVAAWFGLH